MFWGPIPPAVSPQNTGELSYFVEPSILIKALHLWLLKKSPVWNVLTLSSTVATVHHLFNIRIPHLLLLPQPPTHPHTHTHIHTDTHPHTHRHTHTHTIYGFCVVLTNKGNFLPNSKPVFLIETHWLMWGRKLNFKHYSETLQASMC